MAKSRFFLGVGIWAAAAGSAAADEIVVSGERREQAALASPLSINTLGGEEIARTNADHASEILARAAGVYINRGNGQEHLTSIRSPVLTGGAGAGSFLYLQDGVPLRAAGFANVNGLFEAHTEIADRIEIVKGPGGPLYGANAIHGVVNVISPSPGDETTARLSITGDTVERVKGSAIGETAIGGDRFLAAISLTSEAGYRDESGLDQQKATLRHVRDSRGVSFDTIFTFTNLDQETAGFVQGRDAYLDPVLRRTNANPEAFRNARSAQLQSRIDIDAGEDLRLSLTPYARWADMEFLMHFLPSQALEENSHWSVGLQSALYAFDNGPVSIIAGADAEFTSGALKEEQFIDDVFSYTRGVHYDYQVDAWSVSPFLQARAQLSPRLTAIVGARMDWTRYDYDNLTADGVVGRFLRPPDRADEFTTASPKAALVYELAGGAARLSYARGARPPQTTDLYRLQINQIADPAAPETIDAVELGWRGPLGDRINVDVAGYFMVKDNFFFRDADGFNVNDGRTRHVGADIEVSADLGAGFFVDANAAYGAHTYRFDRPVLSLPNATEAISFGDDVDTAPRWLAGARLLWSPERLPVDGEIEWVFVDDYFMDAANTEVYPGHHVVNLRTSVDLAASLSLTFAVRNLFDRFYAERADYAFGSARYFPAEERTFAFGLRARF